MPQHFAKLAAIVNQQDILILKRRNGLPFGYRSLRRNGKRYRKEEFRTLSIFAFNLKFAAHEFHKRFWNDKAKPSSAIFTRNRAIRLSKSIEEIAQLLACHTDTRIADTERKLYVISNNLFLLNFQRYASAFGKLRRIVNQVCKNLRKAQRVAHQNFRNFWIHVNNQFDRTACNTYFGKGRHFANNILQNKLRNFKILLFRFDFWEVQNVVYNSKKRCSRMANAFNKTLLAFVELRFLN